MPKTSWWSALFDKDKKIQRNKEIQEELFNKNVKLKADKKIEEKVINILKTSLSNFSNENIDKKIESIVDNQSESIVDNLSELDKKEAKLVNESVDKFNFDIQDSKSQELLCNSNVVKEVGKVIEKLTQNISDKNISNFFDIDFIKKILDKNVFLNKSYLKYKKYFNLAGIAKALLTCKNQEIKLGRIGSDIRKILYNGDESVGIDKITGCIAILGPAYSAKSKNITNIQKNTPKVLKEIKDKFVKELHKGKHDTIAKFKDLLSKNDNNISKIFSDYNKNAEIYMYLGVIKESKGQNSLKDLIDKINKHLKLGIKIPDVTLQNNSKSAAEIKSAIAQSFDLNKTESKEETNEDEEENDNKE